MACKTLNEKSSVENAISCIDAYYENKDAYSYIRAQLGQIKAGVDVIDSISYRNQVRNTYIIFDDILNIKIKADADLNKVNNTYKATYSQLEDEILKIRKL